MAAAMALVAAVAAAALAAAAAGAGAPGAAYAQSAPVVCGDRLCSEVPGGHAAWMREWRQAAADSAPGEPDAGGAAGAAGAADDAPAAGAADDAPAAGAADDAPAAGAADAGLHPAAMPEPSTRKLADGVYMIDYLHYVSLVVVSGDDVLITDPSNSLRAPVVRDEVAAITDSPVTTIVLSHEHYDHAGGTDIFAGAEIVCQANCAAVFELDPFGRSPERVDVTFEDFLSLEVGDKTVELHSFGPADGEATTVVYLPDDMIVYTADLYKPRGFTDGRWLGDISYPGVRKVLSAVAEWPMEHAVNAHSPETDPAYLRESAGMVDALYGAVRAEMEGPVADGDFGALVALLDGLPGSLELEGYEDWDGYDEHLPAHVYRMAMGMFHGD